MKDSFFDYFINFFGLSDTEKANFVEYLTNNRPVIYRIWTKTWLTDVDVDDAGFNTFDLYIDTGNRIPDDVYTYVLPFTWYVCRVDFESMHLPSYKAVNNSTVKGLFDLFYLVWQCFIKYAVLSFESDFVAFDCYYLPNSYDMEFVHVQSFNSEREALEYICPYFCNMASSLTRLDPLCPVNFNSSHRVFDLLPHVNYHSYSLGTSNEDMQFYGVLRGK